MFNCALLGKSLCCYVDEREARWSYEKILGGVGRSSLATPDLRWEMVLRLVSSLIYGVGICPLKPYGIGQRYLCCGSLGDFRWLQSMERKLC
jgi:hypothetical protein